MFSTKTGAANLLIGVVTGLILLKIAVSWLTGSIGILAQAADSLLDMLAAVITFSAIRIAIKPADKQHPYGHGKVEDIAGIAQGIFIFFAGLLIIYLSIRQIVEDAHIEFAAVGIAVMAVSIVVSIFLSRHLLKVARATGSIALEANARNIAADVYSALSVLVGLTLVQLTNIGIIDSIIAIGVALYILKIAYDTTHQSLSGLMDEKLPQQQEMIIKDCMEEYSYVVADFHTLRTRRSGNQRYIDVHLVMAKDISLEQAHQTCDQIEAKIQTELPYSSVTIHLEPCNDECEHCSVACSKRRPE